MEIFELELEPRPLIGIWDTVVDPGPLFERAMPALFQHAEANGLRVDGPALGIYFRVSEGRFEMAVALPVTSAIGGGEVREGRLPGGRAVATDYFGPYDGLSSAWSRFAAELARSGYLIRAEGWEEYHEGPESGGAPSTWRTRLVQTVQ